MQLMMMDRLLDGWIGCMRARVHLQKREFVSLFLSFITMLIILFVVRQFVVYRVRRIHRMRAHIYTTHHNTSKNVYNDWT